jgi:hypothetical protein
MPIAWGDLTKGGRAAAARAVPAARPPNGTLSLEMSSVTLATLLTGLSSVPSANVISGITTSYPARFRRPCRRSAAGQAGRTARRSPRSGARSAISPEPGPAPRTAVPARVEITIGKGLADVVVLATRLSAWRQSSPGGIASRHGLPGGARDIRGDDVGGMPVQAAPGPVVPHRGSRVRMGGCFLDVAQRHPGI